MTKRGSYNVEGSGNRPDSGKSVPVWGRGHSNATTTIPEGPKFKLSCSRYGRCGVLKDLVQSSIKYAGLCSFGKVFFFVVTCYDFVRLKR
jgi:hypothetical protein